MVVEKPPNGDTKGTIEDLSGCGPAKLDPTFKRESEHGAWDVGTYGWNTSDSGRNPGYSFAISPQTTGSPKTITMKNRATNDCTLHETNVSYSYTGMQIREAPDRKPLSPGSGQLTVSHDARVQQTGGFSCKQKRAMVTTDLILEDAATKMPAVLSIVHFGPDTSAPVPADGVVEWDNGCAGGDCRIMVHSDQRIPIGSSAMTPISIDFGRLLETYRADINPNKPSADYILRGIQIVSTNVGSDTTTTVANVNATLTPTAPYTGQLTNGANPSLCLDDFNNATQSPAKVVLWPCSPGNSAQNWTVGWDSTLRVNGLCLDAWKAGKTPGTPVGLYQCNGGQNQKFVLGRYDQIWNPISQLCLGMSDYSTTVGVDRLVLQGCTGQPSQKWTLSESGTQR